MAITTTVTVAIAILVAAILVAAIPVAAILWKRKVNCIYRELN